MDPTQGLIGRGPKITALREQVQSLLSRQGSSRLPPLLITGETGTGKGLLARTVHQGSSRSGGQFVELNGAAIPEHLLESELFGYERGAFTDARQSKPGLLQIAHRGTLFLDEVGLLPLSLQAKLLKVLEDGSVRRLGSTRSEPFDVWIISATNEDLRASVRAKRFREDLYHRLAVITLALPPLRDLGSDIDLLAEHAIARACEKYGMPLKRLSAEAQAALKTYHWPGNVRELNGLVERAVLLCPETTIPLATLAFGEPPGIPSRETSPAIDAPTERQHLSDALAQTGWNISRTAAILGITRNTVRARIARHGLRPPGGVARLVEGSPAEPPESGAAADLDDAAERAPEVGATGAQRRTELRRGSTLGPTCPACGAGVAPGNRFCGHCGKTLGPEAPDVSGPRAVAPVLPAPKRLADKILTARGSLEGERKHVTVLFVGVADSARLAQQLDPELLHEIMDRMLRLMTEMVHRYEGAVNQYLGDGLMALFGAPLALEDHALRAVRAAFSIQETCSGYSEQLRREHGVEVQLHFGLNSGPVIVGKIGDDLRMDYTAVGDTTHLATRMEQLAEPGTILVAEATHRLIAGYVRSESLGIIPVEGRLEPVPVYRVTGRRRRRSRLDVSADIGLTAFIGREREHSILEGRLASAMAGRGQVVGIVGEAGIGKSRLVHEFRKSLAPGRVTWLEGHCAPDGQTTPYGPILQLLNTNFDIEEGDNPIQIEEKLRRGLRRVEGDLERILPWLCELYGLPNEDEALKHLTPKDRRQKAFEAIRTLTVAGSQRRPHVFFIEDLHWIDKTSEEYLAFFIESLAGIPVLLITTHRSGYSVRWTDKTYYTQIALDQLSTEQVGALVERVLGTAGLPPDLIRRVYDKAEGNPLFVEEIIASLREQALLVRQNGAFIWAPGASIDFPGTLQDIIRARLDRLEEPVKRTVQTAAVIGRQFGLHLLSRVSAMAQEIESYLATLKHLELVHEVRFFPEHEYAFKHAVIQDTAYRSLLKQRRKALHAAIGQAIEDIYADHLEDYAAILAYQYARSDQPDRAFRYALMAGDHAVRVCATVEAGAHYEQALAAARALPPSPDTQAKEIDAIIKLAGVGATRQDILRNRENLAVGRALAEQLDDHRRLASVLYWVGRIEYVVGNTQAAIEYAEKSLKIAESLADDALTAPPVNLLGRLYWQQGSLPQAITLLERSVEQMLQLGNLNDAATTAGFAGMALADAGEFARAVPRADQGIRLATEIRNPFALAATHYFRGAVRSDRGEWAAALEDFADGCRIAEEVGDRFRVYALKVYEGRALTKAGDPRRGRIVLEECIAIAEQLGTTLFLSRPKAFLAECLIVLGEVEAASHVAQEGVRLAEESGERHGNALAHRALAEALFRQDAPDVVQAEATLLKAIGIQEENGERPELARTLVIYADLLRTSGEGRRARETAERARAMFRDMGMEWDLDHSARLLEGR